jgi:bacterioferritin
MKGNTKLLTVLNSLLADELTAINQYMVHSEMCENCTKLINTSILINK